MCLGKKSFFKKCLALLLSVSVVAADVQMVSAGDEQTNPSAGVICISTAEELAKIGTDAAYPMDGDYELSADIDLSGTDWMPLGGYIGTKGTMDKTEANVFSGTFDGNGHVISGLTMNLEGSVAATDKYAQAGLFSVIAGSSAEDYASVKNIIFTDVDIRTDFSDGFAAVGTLAGEVNGYSKIDQIAVLSGGIEVNPSGKCDTVGVGGIIGECRTQNTTVGNSNISVTNCYNGAEINANGTRTDLIYAGGIIGRIAKSACKAVTQCVNVGAVQYDGYNAYGIAAAESSNAEYIQTVSDCYYIDGNELLSVADEATAISEAALMSGSLPTGFSSEIWTARENCYLVPSICFSSSVADFIYLSGLSLEYADGESAKAFSTSVVLPSEIEGIVLSWTSSNEKALTVADGYAIANTAQIGADTTVTLTVTTEKGHSKSYRITVISSIQKRAKFDAAYAKAGTALTVSVENAEEGETFHYTWKVGGTEIDNQTNSFIPKEADLEKFIDVRVESEDGSYGWDLTTYCSELPVVYIDTTDGSAVDSNTVAEDAYIKVQGNDEFNNSKYYYEGDTTIKGRGNSTWSAAVSMGVKRPYKLKLDSKANLLGLGSGKNKHWVLLANMIDHTNMRNELVYDFAKDIGMDYSVAGTNVVLILNGQYQGVYELCEHLRVGSSRVNVFDWEDFAGDIAEKIQETETSLDADALTTAMEQDYSWLDGSFTYQGKTYRIADYYTEEIPDFTGGFMLDMDFRSTSPSYAYKFISTFQSSNGIPMFFRAPEYAKTSTKMMNYAKNYINAYEAALKSDNYTTEYNGETVHYTDLFDLDSLVQYWFVCEYTNNWDSMKNSTYLYKDLNGKAKMGPVWDYDWAFGNINMYSMTGPFVIENWHTTLTGIFTGQGGFCEQGYQANQWNRYLVTDPYFVTKVYEAYEKYRPTVIEDMIKDGGKIDTLEQKYQKASEANDAKWSYSYGNYSGYAFIDGKQQYTKSQTYNDAVESLKTFIIKRVDWMDTQFTSVEKLYESLGNSVSDSISITRKVDAASGNTIAEATVTDSKIAYLEFIINGKTLEDDTNGSFIPVVSGKAEVTLTDNLLETEAGARNTLQVLAVNSAGNYINNTTNFINFTKEVTPQLDGTVTIQGTAKAGEILTAAVSGYEGTGTLSYQWYADGKAISGAIRQKYVVSDAEVGKVITVVVNSDAEEGSLTSAATALVEKADIPESGEAKTGLLINQIYGGGAAGSTPISHDFIELYNNSEEDIVLNEYKIGYLSNRSGKDGSTEGKIVELTLNGTISAKQSYLIRCAENETAVYEDSTLLPYKIEKYDITWNRVIDNKQYQIILYNPDGTVADAVSVGEAEIVNADITEMVRLEAGTISKQKSLRRAEMGNFYAVEWYNSSEEVVMITSKEQLDALRPHSLEDGCWAGEPGTDSDPEPNPDPDPEPNPDPDPEPNPDPNPDPEPNPEPQPEPNPEPNPNPIPNPDPDSNPETPFVTSMQMSISKKSLQVYDKLQLTVAILPQNASQSVKWTSSKPSVATVSSAGVVKAVKAGTTVITAAAADGSGKKAVCTITVKKPSVKVTGNSSVKRNKSITLKVQLLGVKGKVKVSLDKKGKTLFKITKSDSKKVVLKAKNKKGTAKVTVQCGKYKTVKKIKVK